MSGSENFVEVWVHRKIIKAVGAVSVRQGVPLKTAFCAALWAFSKLTLQEKKALVQEYLDHGMAELQIETPQEDDDEAEFGESGV